MIKKEFIEWLKVAMKNALPMASGFTSWIVKIIIENLFNVIGVPIINFAIRKGLVLYDKNQGKIKVKKLRKAKEEGNEQDYNDTIDDV